MQTASKHEVVGVEEIPAAAATCDAQHDDLGGLGHVCHPTLILEVVSPGAERVNIRQTFSARAILESLEGYGPGAQTVRKTTRFRRTDDRRAVQFSKPGVSILLSSPPFTPPLAAIYEGP